MHTSMTVIRLINLRRSVKQPFLTSYQSNESIDAEFSHSECFMYTILPAQGRSQTDCENLQEINMIEHIITKTQCGAADTKFKFDLDSGV